MRSTAKIAFKKKLSSAPRLRYNSCRRALLGIMRTFVSYNSDKGHKIYFLYEINQLELCTMDCMQIIKKIIFLT